MGRGLGRRGRTRRLLDKEPQLDPTKRSARTSRKLRDLKATLSRFNELSMKFAEPMTDEKMNALLAEQADLQT